MSKRRTALVAVLGLIAVAGVFMAIAAIAPVKPAVWSMSADAPQDKRWQAVAPGRVEAVLRSDQGRNGRGRGGRQGAGEGQ